MIGLIAPNLASVRNWLDATKVPDGTALWLQSPALVRATLLHSVILLTGWEERPDNHEIYIIAAAQLRGAPVPISDPDDQEIATTGSGTMFFDSLAPIVPQVEGSTPETDFQDLIRRISDRILMSANAPRTELGDDTDRARMLRFVHPRIYDMLTTEEHGHLMSLIRNGNSGDAFNYAVEVTRRHDAELRGQDFNENRRQRRINQIVQIMGPADRDLYERAEERDLERLLRLAQEISILTDREQSRRNELTVMFQERVLALMMRETPPAAAMPEGPPTQRVRPPTSAPPRRGPSIPFEDIFSPSRNRRSRFWTD